MRKEARESEEEKHRRIDSTIIQVGENLDKRAQLVRERQSAEEGRRIEFIQKLDLVRGLYIVYLIHSNMHGKTYNLNRCRSSRKQAFFRAKARAIKGEDSRRKG